jgi:hypothetical protein
VPDIVREVDIVAQHILGITDCGLTTGERHSRDTTLTISRFGMSKPGLTNL